MRFGLPMSSDQVGERFSWRGKRIAICLLLGVLLLALSVRLRGLDAKGVWQDEIFTAAIASTEHSAAQVASIAVHNSALPTPPLYFLITHFFLYIGDNDFLLRFPALFFGVLGVATTYTLGARLFGKREGLLGAFLLSISPLHIRYSQDARFYNLLLLLALFSLYSLYRGVFGKDRKWWIAFTITSVLNLYNHLFAVLVLLSEIIFAAGLWCAQSVLTSRRPAFSKRASDARDSSIILGKGATRALVVSLVVIGLAYAPWLPYLLRGLTGRKGLGGAATGGVGLTPSFLVEQLDAWGIGSGWAILVFLVPFVVGAAFRAGAQRRQLWLALCWLIVPSVVLSALPVHHRFRPRYFLFMVPLYLLFVARGLTAVSEMISTRWRVRIRLLEISLVTSVLAMGFLSMPALQAYYAEDRVDWRTAAALIADHMSPGDVIVSPGAFAQVALPRYQERLGEADFVIGGSEVYLASAQEPQEGFWFVGLQEERMRAIESELREAVDFCVKVVLEVDDETVARSRSLKIAPVMYKDLWLLYLRRELPPREVAQLYESALELEPSGAALSVHVGLGDLHRAENELEEALVHYQAAVAVNPYAPEPHYGLALVYEAQGLQEQYLSEWQTYEALTAQ